VKYKGKSSLGNCFIIVFMLLDLFCGELWLGFVVCFAVLKLVY
jgi:hypothetical protein